MKIFRSILLPVITTEPRHILENALALADWFRADLHVLVEPARIPGVQALLKSAAKETKCESPYFIHPWTGNRLSEFVDATEIYHSDAALLGLQTAMHGVSDAPHSLEKDILEQCPVPILLAPSHRTVKPVPVHSLLVAISGERIDNEALDLAIHLANTSQIPVDILHVSSPASRACACEVFPFECMQDQFHHEYSKLVEQLAAQASPFSSVRERRCIRNFSQSAGDVTSEILKKMRTNPGTMLVLEWKGVLAAGRAKTLRKILLQCSTPVLLVKPRERHQAHLKIGNHFGRFGT